MPKTVAEYPDAVQRIVAAHVDPGLTTRQQVQSALSGASAPQVTDEVARDMVDAVVTEERVIEAIESTGEVPREAEIDAITSVSDDYDMDDRVREVAAAVEGRVVTLEEVERAVSDRRVPGRPTFREEVETAVDEVSSRKELVGASADEVVSDQAREIGAPRENDFRREAAQTVAQSEQITPSDVVEGTSAKTPVQVIRDTAGNPVAATGGPSDEIGSQVAEQVGADYMSTEEVVSEINTEGTGDSVSLTLRGRKVGEVRVE